MYESGAVGPLVGQARSCPSPAVVTQVTPLFVFLTPPPSSCFPAPHSRLPTSSLAKCGPETRSLTSASHRVSSPQSSLWKAFPWRCGCSRPLLSPLTAMVAMVVVVVLSQVCKTMASLALRPENRQRVAGEGGMAALCELVHVPTVASSAASP